MPQSRARPKVFLSHNSRDKPWVAALARRLESVGIDCWFDDWDIQPGQPIDEAIESALEECSCCLVLLGPHGQGPWHREEIRAWLWESVGGGTEAKRIIPVLLPGATAASARDHLPMPLRRRRWVEFPGTGSDTAAFDLLLRGIRGEQFRRSSESREGVPGGALELPELPPVNLPYLCDRNPQEDELRGFLEARGRSGTGMSRPLLFLVHGPAHEAHIPFLERLEKRDLPRWLGQIHAGVAWSKGQVKRLPMERPLGDQDARAFAASYRSRMAAGIQSEGPCASDVELVDRLVRAGIGMALPTLELSLSELFEPQPRSYLELIREYWSNFPDLSGALCILAFVAVKTPVGEAGGLERVKAFLPWTESSRSRRQQERLVELSRGLPSVGDGRSPAAVLPPLESAKRTDVSRWSDLPEVRPRLGRYLSEKQLETIFEGRPVLPMDDAIDRLAELIASRPSNEPHDAAHE